MRGLAEYIYRRNLGFWLGYTTLEENRSRVSEHAPKAVQSRNSKVDQVWKCTPRAPLWSSEKD